MNREHAYHVRRASIDTIQDLLNAQAKKGYRLLHTRTIGRQTDFCLILFNETVFTMMEHDWIHAETARLAGASEQAVAAEAAEQALVVGPAIPQLEGVLVDA
jgi:hypothetical protein